MKYHYLLGARPSKWTLSFWIWLVILIPPSAFFLFLTSAYSSNQTVQELISLALILMAAVWLVALVAYFKGVSRYVWGNTPREQDALANYYMTCPSCGYDCSTIPDFTACPECGLTGTADRFREIWTNTKAR